MRLGIEKRLLISLAVYVDEISRRIINSFAGARPAFSSNASNSGFGVTENSPSIDPRSVPDFNSSLVNLPPISTPSASTMIDLPDPVSPVSRLRPFSNSTCRSSIKAMLEMFRN
jgi:hypothetical protein